MTGKSRNGRKIEDIENDFFDTHVAYSIIAVANLITLNTMKNTLAGTGLSVNEWRVMRMAAIHGSICAADIIDLFGLDKTTTGRAISRLRERKLVKLAVDADDKRQTNISLSAPGRKMHDRVIQHDSISDNYIETILSQREIKSFHSTMRKLRRHIKQMLEDRA